MAYSLNLPYYTNAAAKEKLESETNDKMLSSNGSQYKTIKAKYYADVDKLQTNKNLYFDLGSGISVASFIIFIFLLGFKIKHYNDFLGVKSVNKTLIYLIAIPVWLLMIPGTIWYYTLRAERGDYPAFADSIAIPIMYGAFSICVGLLLLILFLILTTRKSIFPTLVFIKPINYKKTILIKEVLWGVLLFLNLCCFIGFVIDGDHILIIVNLFFTYLILTLRAGQINRYNQNMLAAAKV